MSQRGIAVAVIAVLAIILIVIVYRNRDTGLLMVGPSQGAGSPQTSGQTLYDRLGGEFAVAAVIDSFSDEILKSPIVGVDSPNPALRQWSRKQAGNRLPGLKFMRTLWVTDVAGGSLHYKGTKPGPTRLDLSVAHRDLHITSQEFDEVARILSNTLDRFHVPAKEKGEVLGAFAAHKSEVVGGTFPRSGSHFTARPIRPPIGCPYFG